uniref:Ovule protein n=1 Tax=Anisakis simplex TaxID=6269 RepID=A0A0M3IYC6_ANISI
LGPSMRGWDSSPPSIVSFSSWLTSERNQCQVSPTAYSSKRGPLFSSISLDERPLHKFLMGYGFVIVFCSALLEHYLNLITYSSNQIPFHIAMCTKLIRCLNQLVFEINALLTVLFLFQSSCLLLFCSQEQNRTERL